MERLTDEQRRITSALRGGCEDCSCLSGKFMCDLGPCENLNAADMIERLAKEIDALKDENERIRQTYVAPGVYRMKLDELERVKRERDAAVRDMLPHCPKCKHFNTRECKKRYKDYIDSYYAPKKNCWEWRGPCAGNGGAEGEH